jgi:hypothetical protein
MKKIKQICFVIGIGILFGCNKEVMTEKYDEEYNKALNQLSSIVKGKGKVFKIEHYNDSNYIISNEYKNSPIQKLSLDDFKNTFSILTIKTNSFAKAEFINKKDSITIKSSSIKRFDEIEGYDSVRPAGSYKADFTLFPSQFYDGRTGGFYNLHLSFQTNSFGQVIGDPKVYLTGIGLSGWQQMSVSAISFNKALTTSTFIVHGITTFGISFSNGGMTLGFTMERDYLFNISMESYFQNKAVYVEQN